MQLGRERGGAGGVTGGDATTDGAPASVAKTDGAPASVAKLSLLKHP